MQTEHEIVPQPPIAPADQAIGLRIAGADLLLSGRFGQWMPLVLADGSAVTGAAPANDSDSGLATAQVLFDVTSNRTAPRTTGAAPVPGDLFSFTATDVESMGKQAYKLKGKLRAEGKTAEVEALLRSPKAHTPFFVIVFRFDQQRFPGLWSALEARVEDGGAGELRPTAWLRPPDLAAA